MGLLSWIGLRGSPAPETETKGVIYSKELEDFFVSGGPASDVKVNWNTARDVSTVFACCRVIAEGIAQVPLRVMRELPDGRGSVPAMDHPLYKVLNRKPNPWQTSFALRETMILHLLLTGNAFLYKVRARGVVRELIAIDPGCVIVERLPDFSLKYTITDLFGDTIDVPPADIWHVRGPSWDTWSGLDPVRQAREAIGLTIATERTQAELHRNGLQMSGTYATEQNIGPEQYVKIQKWIAAQVGGPNKHKPFVIDSGFKWTPQTMKGVDAQHLDTRKFQIEEICRSFRVFPAMVGHSGQSMTFASAEQIFLAHVMHTLQPWVERLEQSIDNDLLNEDGDEQYFAQLNMNSLQRGAFKDRFEGYSKALGSGGSPAWLTPNEIRALEDMNPVEGGDELPKPTNVAPAANDNAPPAAAQVEPLTTAGEK